MKPLACKGWLTPIFLSAARTLKFSHKFKGGCTCTMTVDLDLLAAKEADHVRCEWSSKPGARVIPEYRMWILSVWQRVANITGFRLMELLQTKRNVWEAWLFEPGRAPKKVAEEALP